MRILCYVNLQILITIVNCQREVPREEIHGFIGVGFCQTIQSLEFLKDYMESIEFELVTEDKKTLFSSTWLKYRWISNEVYGLPLEGNQGVSTYYIKVVSNNHVEFHEIKIFISPTFGIPLHEIKLCTRTLTANEFMGSLDTRYALVDILAEYLMDTTVENVKIKGFQGSCFKISFLHIEESSRCNFPAVRKLQKRIFDGSNISEEFRKELSRIDTIIAANLTLLGNCIKRTTPELQKKHLWLKTVAPLLVLAGVIGIPVSIACYVGRGVQRRQNRMLQQQDKILKEEEAKLKAQIEEYQKGCGFYQESFDSGISDDRRSGSNSKTKGYGAPNKKEQPVLISKTFDQYIPKFFLDKYRKNKLKGNLNSISLNPLNSLLDIRSDKDKRRLREARNKYALQAESSRETESSQKTVDRSNSSIHLIPPRTSSKKQLPREVIKQPPNLLKAHKVISFSEMQAQEQSNMSVHDSKRQSLYRKVPISPAKKITNRNSDRTRRQSTSVINNNASHRQHHQGRKKISLPERFNISVAPPQFMSYASRGTISSIGTSSANSPVRKVSIIESLRNFVMNSAMDLTDANHQYDSSVNEESVRTTPSSSFPNTYHGHLSHKEDRIVSPILEDLAARSTYHQEEFQGDGFDGQMAHTPATNHQRRSRFQRKSSSLIRQEAFIERQLIPEDGHDHTQMNYQDAQLDTLYENSENCKINNVATFKYDNKDGISSSSYGNVVFNPSFENIYHDDFNKIESFNAGQEEYWDTDSEDKYV